MELTSIALKSFFGKISELPVEYRMQTIVTCLNTIERRLVPCQSTTNIVKLNYLKHIFTEYFYKEIIQVPIADQEKYFGMKSKQPTLPLQLNESEELITSLVNEINMIVFTSFGPKAMFRQNDQNMTKGYSLSSQFKEIRLPVGPVRTENHQRALRVAADPHRQEILCDTCVPITQCVIPFSSSTSGNSSCASSSNATESDECNNKI